MLAVRISLNKPLVSQFKINGNVKKGIDGAAQEVALEAPIGTKVTFIPPTTIHTNVGNEDQNREDSFGP